MERLDSHTIPNDTNEIRLFAKIRNEADRLEHFFDYYEKIGISRFFIVDNASDDNTLSVVKSRRNCHVFSTQERMSSSQAGMLWIRPLLNQFGLGHWCLVVDADEILIYSEVEKITLHDFCRAMDERDENALFCMMIDMYPDGDISYVPYQRGQAFVEACPFFDSEGYIELKSDSAPYVFGGPRQRHFYPEFKHGMLGRIERGLRHRVSTSLLSEFYPALKTLRPVYPPLLTKVPLVKWSHGMEFNPAAHFLKGAKLSAAKGALLHFKFIGDFKSRVEQELTRKAYHKSGAEYVRYGNGLNRSGRINFMCEMSTRFEGSHSLAEHGLIKAFPSFERTTDTLQT